MCANWADVFTLLDKEGPDNAVSSESRLRNSWLEAVRIYQLSVCAIKQRCLTWMQHIRLDPTQELKRTSVCAVRPTASRAPTI